MRVVNLYEAKTHLSRLVDQVAAGEEVVIARAGKPVAKLVPDQTEAQPREPGYWRGRVRLAADFDSGLPEPMAAAFRGEAP
jgi:prevent-host-death family protein